MFAVQNEERREDNMDFIIAETKVLFVFFPFEPIAPVQRVKQVKMYSDYDLLLNKIYVTGRRIDPKDPFDAATLLVKNNWPYQKIK